VAQVNQELDRFVADGMYDQEPVYAAVAQHSPTCWITISPRKNAVLNRMLELGRSQSYPVG
jgi:hypothetical protein